MSASTTPYWSSCGHTFSNLPRLASRLLLDTTGREREKRKGALGRRGLTTRRKLEDFDDRGRGGGGLGQESRDGPSLRQEMKSLATEGGFGVVLCVDLTKEDEEYETREMERRRRRRVSNG